MLLVFFAHVSSLKAQRCLTDPIDKVRRESWKPLGSVEKFEEWIFKKRKELKNKAFRVASEDGLRYIIPTVVHVIHENSESIGLGKNISKDQILSQIKQINRDFRLANDDSTKVPDLFRELMVDTGIEFKLTPVDPEGNILEEAGVNRIGFDKDGWTDNQILNELIPNHIWSPDRFLNIWVLGFSRNNLLGFAFLPTQTGFDDLDEQILNSDWSTDFLDGVVMTYDAFGSNYTGDGNFDLRRLNNKGRTLTHELGHYLGLWHPWGRQFASCGDDDYVADTPLTSSDNGNLSFCAFPGPNKCTELVNDYPDMFQNYMDYTRDTCMAMFTKGQAERMHIILENAYNRNEFNINSPNTLLNVNASYDIDSRQVTLTWDVSDENTSVFVIEKSVNSYKEYIKVGQELSGSTSFVDGNVFFDDSDSFINYRVFSVNEFGFSMPAISRVDASNLPSSAFKPNISIYPNPTIHGKSLTIQFRSFSNGIFVIRIVDTVGKEVSKKVLSSSNKTFIETFDVSNYSAGMYLIEVSSPDGRFTEKIYHPGG